MHTPYFSPVLDRILTVWWSDVMGECVHISLLLSLTSMVFLCWEATAALWQWHHCVIKLCAVLYSSDPHFISSSSDPPLLILRQLLAIDPLFLLPLSSSIFYSMSSDSVLICLLLAWPTTEFLSVRAEGPAV